MHVNSLVLKGFLNQLFLFGDSKNDPIMEKLKYNYILPLISQQIHTTNVT